MPIFTSTAIVSTGTSTHVTVSFDGINKEIAMYTGLSGFNSFASVGSSSDVRLNDSNFFFGIDYTGTMSNVELTYGINSPTYIQTYSFVSGDGPVFGYRFDNYKTGTNNEFSDSISSYDLEVKNPTSTHGIKLSDSSYTNYVSSLHFSGDSYLESSSVYNDASPISLVFWVKKGSVGPVFHLNNKMTVEITADQTLKVHFPVKTLITTTSLTNAAAHTFVNFDASWVYVCIEVDSVGNHKIYFNKNAILTTETATTMSVTTDSKIYIGRGVASSINFVGYLDALFAVSALNSVSVESSYAQFQNEASYALSSSALDANQIQNDWTHVAASYDEDSKDLRVYHNGSLFTTYKNYIPNMNPDEIVENSNNMLIGKTNDVAAVFFEGHMDDIRIYENPLNTNDVKNVYAQYFEQGSAGEDALLDAQFDISLNNLTSTTSNVTFSANAPSVGTNISWKAIAIANNELNSRQIINTIINNNSDVSNAIYDASAASLENITLTNVVTIKTSEPNLKYESTLIEYVNRYDVFVYANSSGNESVSRVAVVYADLPKVSIDTASTTSVDFKIFASKFNVIQYFIWSSSSSSETTESVTTSGSATSVFVLKNQLVEFTVTHATNIVVGEYIHIVAVDSEGSFSQVVPSSVV